MDKIKKILYFQTIVIIVLLFFVGKSLYEDLNDDKFKLISPRISSGVLPPQSLLIFNFKPLEQEINSYLNEKQANVSLYVLNIRDGASFGIDENRRFEALSLNKLPVAIIILKKVENGDLSLDTTLPIQPEMRNSAAGTLYNRDVDSLSVGELLRYMLEESDNTAFAVLANEVTLEDGKILTDYLNYYQNELNGSVSPGSLQITPKTTANIFLSLYLSTILEPEHSELILSHLTKTTYDISSFANLPPEVIVAQKYGSFYYQDNEFFHSCGIMYIEDSRIFYCIMTQNLGWDEARQTVGDVVNKIYTYVVKLN